MGPVDVAFMDVHKTTAYKYSLSPWKGKKKTKHKLHLQKPNPFSQLKGDPEKEEVWVEMLSSWDVPTQKTQRNKAFCSNPVLTGPHVQSKCVTKHSHADTSYRIST